MNKRILSILLCVVLVASLLVMAVPVSAAATTLTVTADKTEVNQGDEVTFTVTLGPVSDLGSMQFDLDIPAGLTYVENSGALADGLKEAMNFDAALEYVELTKRVSGGATADYKNEGSTVICTFKCTADADFTGDATVSLTNLEFASSVTWEEWTSDVTVVPATVTVVEPAPATEAPATEAPATEAPAPATEAPATEAPAPVVKPTEAPKPAATQAPATKDTATKDSSSKSSTSAKTGDTTNMYLWMIILLVSVAGVGVVLFAAKRKGLFTK